MIQLDNFYYQLLSCKNNRKATDESYTHPPTHTHTHKPNYNNHYIYNNE